MKVADGKVGWAAAVATGLAGAAGFATSENDNDLAEAAIRQQTMLLRECLIQLAKGEP